MVLAIIMLVITLKADGKEPTPEQVDQICHSVAGQFEKETTTTRKTTVTKPDGTLAKKVERISTQVRKVGRNAQCPCGSNIKYKTCHGAPESVRKARNDE